MRNEKDGKMSVEVERCLNEVFDGPQVVGMKKMEEEEVEKKNYLSWAKMRLKWLLTWHPSRCRCGCHVSIS